MQRKFWTPGAICGIIALSLVALWFLYPALSGLLISLMDYKPFRGIAGSEMVGFENFANFFDYKYFGRLFGNTAALQAIALVIGAIYVFLATWAVSSFKNIFARCGVAFLFAIPFAISPVTYSMIFRTNLDSLTLMEYGFHQYLIAGLANALPMAALFSLGGIFTKGNSLKSALKLTLGFVAVKLVFFLFESFDFQFLMQIPTNLESTETIGTYIYKKGFMSVGYSHGNAIAVVRWLFNLLPAAGGAAIACFLMRKKPVQETLNDTRGFNPGMISSIFAIVPVALAVFAVIAMSGVVSLTDAFDLAYSYGVTIGYAFVTAIIVAAAVPVCSSIASKMGILGAIIISVICTISDNMLAQYLAINWTGTYNNALGVISMMLKIMPLLIMAFAFFVSNDDSRGTKYALFTLAGGLGFTYAWGAFAEPLVALADSDKYPISVISRQILMQPASGSYNLTQDFTAYVIVPVIVLAVFVGLTGLIKFLVDKRAANTPAPVYQQPVYQQPVYQQPVAPQPVYQQPVAPQPVYQQPVAPQPVYQQPVAPQPVYQQPVAPQPVYQQPVAPQPVYQQPVAPQPVAYQPAVAEPTPVAEQE